MCVIGYKCELDCTLDVIYDVMNIIVPMTTLVFNDDLCGVATVYKFYMFVLMSCPIRKGIIIY